MTLESSRDLLGRLDQVLVQKRAIDEALGSLSGSAGPQLQRVTQHVRPSRSISRSANSPRSELGQRQ